MKTQLMETPARRITVAVAVLVVLGVLGAVVYMIFGNPPTPPVNGPKIIAAAHNYTRVLVQKHQTVPASVPLQTLVDQGLLQPADIGALEGLDAKIFLTAQGNGPEVLMTVHMPDGTNLVLLANGTSQRVKP